jgi:hypothetical protein
MPRTHPQSDQQLAQTRLLELQYKTIQNLRAVIDQQEKELLRIYRRLVDDRVDG